MRLYTHLLISFLFDLSVCKIVKDNINNVNADWLFVTRFCFLSSDGMISYHITYPENYGPYKLLLYYDTEDQWPAVYDVDTKSCYEKTHAPHIIEQNGQAINLDPVALTNRGNCSYIPFGTDQHSISCELSRQFASARQRWWYVAISRCNETIDYARGGKKGIIFDYDITLTNGEGLFFEHFSADEFYILQVDISFLLIMIVMVVISVICAISLAEARFYHTTYKLYLASICLHTIYLFFITLAYGIYANNGKDTYAFRMFARVFQIAAYLVYILVLILMAKGFTITRGQISNSGAIKIVIFLTLYTVGFIVLYIFEARFMDPGKVLYLYESPPGYALIAMRVVAWVWFCYGIIFTLKHYPEKKKFYVPFFLFFTLWFLAGPIVILIANFVISEWVRATVVNAVELFITFLGYLIFLLVTLPCCVNTVFPYHIRTTQIDVLPATSYPHEKEDNNNSQQNGGGTFIYGTSHNNGLYLNPGNEKETEFSRSSQPVAHVIPNGAPNFAELFLTSNTRSSDEPTRSRTFGQTHNTNAGFEDDQVVGKPLDTSNNPFVTDPTSNRPPELANGINGSPYIHE